MKYCSKCKQYKSISDFSTYNYLGKIKIYYICKSCKNITAKEFTKQNPDRKRNNRLKRIYGLSEQDYIEMLKLQGGVCAICSGPPTSHHKKYVVDHDHVTGNIRGLLCHKCNSTLGFFNDDALILYRAAHYLTKNRFPEEFKNESRSL